MSHSLHRSLPQYNPFEEFVPSPQPPDTPKKSARLCHIYPTTALRYVGICCNCAGGWLSKLQPASCQTEMDLLEDAAKLLLQVICLFVQLAVIF